MMIPRFVILFHQIPHQIPLATYVLNRPVSRGADHWDLMLEREKDLATWSLADEPRPGRHMQGIRLPPHRKHYLDFEGEVSENRGFVTRVMAGTYRFSDCEPLRLLDLPAGEKEQFSDPTASSSLFHSHFSAPSFSIELDLGSCFWKVDFNSLTDAEWEISIEETR